MRRHYRPVAEACASVRRDLRAFLESCGADAEATDVAVLVANELASNVIDHAGTPFVVTVTLSAEAVRIEVEDGSGSPPVVRPPDVHAARGRGLQLIEALAGEWTYVRTAAGKIVCADVPAARAPLRTA
ncbi:ATP-binding protein [Pseudonocardia sp. T1-2H]|uniref:ATP-binding protein n=1 Tax=Pseudonocardia sp. T1-2H TaxID=3128899 RepID=UPI003100E1F0